MSNLILGAYFPPASTMTMPARLLHDPDKLALQVGDLDTTIDPASCRISDRIAGVPRRVTLADGAVFVSDDDDGLDQVFPGRTGGMMRRVAALERPGQHVVGLAAVTIALIGAVVLWIMPLAGDALVGHLPYRVQDRIGGSTLQALDLAALRPTQVGDLRQREVTAIFNQLVLAADQPQIQFRLLIRRGGRLGANAFALPGGRVIITDELIGLALNDNGIAGVLAHEIGHVVERHGLRRVSRAVVIGALVALVVGDPTPILTESGALVAWFLDLAYSRDFERDADDYAARLMLRIGRPPAALADMLDRLTRAHSGAEQPSWLSSHPATVERIETLRRAR